MEKKQLEEEMLIAKLVPKVRAKYSQTLSQPWLADAMVEQITRLVIKTLAELEEEL